MALAAKPTSTPTSMIVSINQPAYLPWLGFFDRIAKSDLHIVLDHVQFEKGSFTNRTRIRQRDGRVMWLTVPVEKGKPINETRISPLTAWVHRHRTALAQSYETCPIAILNYERLIDLIRSTTAQLVDSLDRSLLTKSWISSSELRVQGTKSELVLNLCKEVGADQYLSGPFGRDYLDLPSFDKAGIEVVWHDYQDPDDPPLSAVHHLFTRSTPMWQPPISPASSSI